MSVHLSRLIVGTVGVSVMWVLLYVGSLRWWTPERRRADAWKWAQRHLASYDERWLEPVERQMLSSFRIDCVCMILLSYVLFVVPTSAKAYIGCLVALPTVMAILRGLAFSRVVVPPGERVARLRELTVEDYLPKRTRVLMWRCGAAGSLTCLVLGFTRDQWFVAVSGLLLLAAPATVDLAGARLARTPEPAESAAHLYTQDAFRSGLIRMAALRSAMGGTYVCLLVSWALVFTEPVWAVGVVLGVVLFVAMFREARGFGKAPAAYMRSRLWPTLAPGQVLAPGDPVPAGGATA
jgi:hypothetical protein